MRGDPIEVYKLVNKLYDQQSSMVLTLCEHNLDILPLPTKFQLLVYYGNSLYQLGEYKRAESVLRKSLQLRKMMNKCKTKTSQQEMCSEVDVKYCLYQCYTQLKQTREAIAILEGISSKFRTPRINVALARLYHKTGMDRSAVTSYKEVLRECPFSLAAAEGLLSLDVKGPEVNTLMLHGLQGGVIGDWLSMWIKAQAQAANKEYSNAANTFKSLDIKPILRDNVDILCSLGHMQFLQGHYTEAMQTLQRANALEPFLLNKMDLLSYLLAREKKSKELETLSTNLMQVSKTAPEPWISVGYYCMQSRRGTQAVYFAQKAYAIDNRNVEALILKGFALLELKKVREAIMHFREAYRLAPYRYEAHKGLVECYIAGQRLREANSCATQAIQHLGTNARSLTLYASTLAKESSTVEKAKSCLEKALKLQPSHLEAVYLMADILLVQGQNEKGVDLLRKQLRQQSTCRLHQLLGDFLSRTNEHQEALDQYNIAFSLDPTNCRVREGMERVEKHGDLGSSTSNMDNSYDVEVEDNTDNEAGLDGSDIESAWSDIDLM